MCSRSFLLCVCFIGISWIVALTDADPCPELYRRYSATHTYCLPPNAACTILKSSVNAEDKRIILKEHNKYRSNIAMGQERIGQLPKAADMLQMMYDDELAAIAQKHANQCKFEHDCNECRQTKDFDAGQNLYMRYRSGDMPNPNWRAAVKSWYDEVSSFDRSIIFPFDASKGRGVIGHFTQVVWSKSWKIGCGYSVYKEGGVFKELYVCNYGPAGNVVGDSMYEIGETCSKCPINSCCGNSCGQSDYPGLCRITDGRGPKYEQKFPGELIFFCNFEAGSKCPVQTSTGMKQWKTSDSLSGSYTGVVLAGGESSSLNVTRPFMSNTVACLSIHYRKGPNVAGQASANIATEHFLMTSTGSNLPIRLNADSTGFYKFGMNLNWVGVEFLFSISFSVPHGRPAQYFKLQDIVYTKGRC